jgi:hypothetical protein
VVLFLFLGAWLVLDQLYPPGYSPDGLLAYAWYNAWGVVWLIVAALGFTAGYLRDFPRWSYAYTGLFFFTGLSYRGVVQISALTYLPLIMLAICLLVGLAVKRSLKPLGKLFTNLGADASQLSFALYASLPVLTLLLFRDMRQPYFLTSVSLLAALMLGTTWFYLRASTVWRRSAVLAVSLFVTILIYLPEILIPSLGGGLTQVEMTAAVSISVGYCVFVLLPAVIGCLHELFEPSTPIQMEPPQ